MIGMVLVTHARLAEEFLAALVHVMGPQDAVATVCIGPTDAPDECRGRIIEAIAKVEQGDGVVVLTDLYGGTPSNLAISVKLTTNPFCQSWSTWHLQFHKLKFRTAKLFFGSNFPC